MQLLSFLQPPCLLKCFDLTNPQGTYVDHVEMRVNKAIEPMFLYIVENRLIYRWSTNVFLVCRPFSPNCSTVDTLVGLLSRAFAYQKGASGVGVRDTSHRTLNISRKPCELNHKLARTPTPAPNSWLLPLACDSRSQQLLVQESHHARLPNGGPIAPKFG